MKKTYITCALVLIVLVPILIIACVDNAGKRMFIDWRVSALVNSIRHDKDSRPTVEKLITMAEGSYRFGACRALNGIGQIGPDASPIVRRVAVLLRGPDPFVRRQAALTLGNLGQVSLPAKDLVLEVALNGDPREDTTMFCVEALSRMDAMDIQTSSRMRKRLGRSDLLDEYIRDALAINPTNCPQ